MGFYKRFNSQKGVSGSARIIALRNETFFDRRPVIAALDKKLLSVMARLGGYIRTTMQRSMKSPKAGTKQLRGQKTNDRHGNQVEIDSKGRVVTAHGRFLPKDEAKIIKDRLAKELAEGRPSKPGTPPNKHDPPTLQKLIEFGYDKNDKTLICGPQLITSPTKPLGGKTVPQLHNEGGHALVKLFGQMKLCEYPARPFVHNAKDKGMTRLAKLLADTPLIVVKGR